MDRFGDFQLLREILPASSAAAIEEFVCRETAWRQYEEQYVEWVRWTNAAKQVFRTIDEFRALRAVGAALIERDFAAVVGRHYKILGHKMLPGESVEVHNDSPKHSTGNPEQFRFVYFVDTPGTCVGGEFFLFAKPNDREPVARIPPFSNTGVLFRLSDSSYHAVSTVNRGVRHSVIVSYWAYPLLLTDCRGVEIVRRCLRAMIGAGLEDGVHHTPNLLRRSHDVYTALVGWGAPIQICLAGLVGAVFQGRSSSVVRSKIRGLVGDDVFQLARDLNSGVARSASGTRKTTASLIRLATCLVHSNRRPVPRSLLLDALQQVTPLVKGRILSHVEQFGSSPAASLS